MRKSLLSALAVAVLLGGSSICPAQDVSPEGLKPVAVVSFSGYDEVLGDIDFIGKLADNPQLAGMAQMLVMQATGGQGLAGIDQKRPWGVVVQTDGQQFPLYGFVPVTDLQKLLGVLAPLVGEPTDAGDGVLEITVQGQPVYLREMGGWVIVGNTADVLANVPGDPSAALDGLNESYDLGVRVSVKNIPEMYRQMALTTMQLGLRGGMQQPMPGESDEEFALRTKMAERALDQIIAVINDLDTLLIGFAVDQQSESTYLDYVVTLKEGTKSAEQLSQAGELTTNFAGLRLPDAAVTINAVSKIAESDADQLKGMIAAAQATAMKEIEQQGLGEEELEQAKQIIGDLLEVIEATIDDGRLDVAAALVLDPDALTFVWGMHVADTDKLDGLVKQLVKQLIKDEPKAADAITLDAQQYQGVRFHTMSIPTEEIPDNDILKHLVGSTLDMVLGIGNQRVYVAVGRDAEMTLRQVVNDSASATGADMPPVQISVAATPIAKFVAAMADDDKTKMVANSVAQISGTAAGKDRVTLTSIMVPNGVKIRLELEKGVLKVVGSLPMLLMGMAGPAEGGS